MRTHYGGPASAGPFAFRGTGGGTGWPCQLCGSRVLFDMRVTVLLFASYADALGARTLTLDLPDAARAGDVVRLLRARPGADALPPSPLVAVNERYAAAEAAVGDGDVIAILPPVAGG